MRREQHVDKNPQADIEDIGRALQGDGEAYAHLVRRYEAGIARQMWHFTRDRATRDNLVHDVFVEAYLSLPTYQGKAPFEHWLRRIATRTGYRHWKNEARDRERKTSLELLCSAAIYPERLTPSEAAECAFHMLENLPAKDRLVLTLLHIEEWNVDEIAQCMGWSRALVKVRAYRARRKLRAQLEAEGFGKEPS
ncbi:MAG TPA: RNA polymerase sigma factor [Candidatus Hydrogenedentes bacterium]|nr:RNA polymerase sigma factor [Candidatus Hydrogenedentota bacterium]